MAGPKKAKVASSKTAVKKFKFGGKIVKPCVYKGNGKTIVCGEYDGGGIVFNEAKQVIPWSELKTKCVYE